MRKFTIVRSLLIALLLSACSDGFSVEFNEIEETKNRMIAFKPMSPELAPGDTVVMEASFAGEDINQNYICSLALDVHTTVYGDEIDGKIVDIEKYKVHNPNFPDIVTNNYIRFSFVVPDSVFYYSQSIPEYPFTMLEEYIADQFPDTLTSMTKEEFIPFATAFLENYDFATADEQTLLMGNVIAQMMSVKLRLNLFVNGNEFRRALTSRLHKKVQNNNLVQPNRNTTIHWVKLFSVKDDGNGKTYFDPKETDRAYSYFYLHADEATLASDPTAVIDSVIQVTDGYLYYVQADTGVSAYNPHSDRDLFSSMIGTQGEEFWINNWFFQQEASQIVDVKLEDQANMTGGFGTQQIFPPNDKTITYIDTWCLTSDMTIGERLRPMGQAVEDFRIHFRW